MAAGLWIIAVILAPSPIHLSLCLKLPDCMFLIRLALTWIDKRLSTKNFISCCSSAHMDSLNSVFPFLCVCTYILYRPPLANGHPTPRVVSPTTCVQGDRRPLGGFHQILIRWHVQSKARRCTHWWLNTFIQIECGKHVSRPVGTRPDIIVAELCSIVDTSVLLQKSRLLCFLLSLANQLY